MLRIAMGNPGALLVMFQSRDDLPQDWVGLIGFLDQRGRHGSRLWKCFRDGCCEDFGVLGRDLLSRIFETPTGSPRPRHGRKSEAEAG
jgi:hypothetical protein